MSATARVPGWLVTLCEARRVAGMGSSALGSTDAPSAPARIARRNENHFSHIAPTNTHFGADRGGGVFPRPGLGVGLGFLRRVMAAFARQTRLAGWSHACCRAHNKASPAVVRQLRSHRQLPNGHSVHLLPGHVHQCQSEDKHQGSQTHCHPAPRGDGALRPRSSPSRIVCRSLGAPAGGHLPGHAGPERRGHARSSLLACSHPKLWPARRQRSGSLNSRPDGSGSQLSLRCCGRGCAAVVGGGTGGKLRECGRPAEREPSRQRPPSGHDAAGGRREETPAWPARLGSNSLQ